MACKHGTPAPHECSWLGEPPSCDKCYMEVLEGQLEKFRGKLASREWQPIESAPKDGTDVMLFGIRAGEVSGVSEFPGIDIGCWADGKSDYGDDGWWYSSCGDAYQCWCKATHWMPLPYDPN